MSKKKKKLSFPEWLPVWIDRFPPDTFDFKVEFAKSETRQVDMSNNEDEEEDDGEYGKITIEGELNVYLGLKEYPYPRAIIIRDTISLRSERRLNTAIASFQGFGWEWDENHVIGIIVRFLFVHYEYVSYLMNEKSIFDYYPWFTLPSIPLWTPDYVISFWEEYGSYYLNVLPRKREYKFSNSELYFLLEEHREMLKKVEMMLNNSQRGDSASTGSHQTQAPSTSAEFSNVNQPESTASDFEHSPDYRNCLYKGEEHKFTKNQAAIVKVLHEAGGKTLHQKEILNKIGIDCRERFRLSNFFRKSKAWDNLIKSTGRGFYRLNL